MSSQPGITLLELLAVVLLLAVAAGIGTPAVLRSLQPPPAQRVAKEVGAHLTRARKHALDRAVPVRVVLSTSTAVMRAWSVESDRSLVLFEQPLDLSGGVTLGSTRSRAEVVFNPSGSALGDSIVVLSSESRLHITVDHLTGIPSVR